MSRHEDKFSFYKQVVFHVLQSVGVFSLKYDSIMSKYENSTIFISIFII
jgi:hypothetical protein